MTLMNRRQFLGKIRTLLGFLSLGFIGCKSSSERPYPPRPFKITNLSELKEGANFFPVQRVMLYKQGEALSALSMVCTHQACLLSPTEKGFSCPCHGSQFELDGKVVTGPATQDLLKFEVSIGEDGSVSILR